MALALEMDGFSVKTAGDGQQALAVLREIVPAVMVVDIMMPVMDGIQFREIQRNDAR